MGISYETMIAYLFIFMLAIIFLAVLASPIKWLFKAIFNSVVGTVGIITFNIIGGYLGFTLGLNPGSIITVGILGIPGFIMLIFLKLYLM